jgi:nitrile hydratase accessory protein
MTIERFPLPASCPAAGAADGCVFAEPWQARGFAITVALQRAGLFTRKEWAASLGAEICKASPSADAIAGEVHYRHWLVALEKLVAEKGAADATVFPLYREAWVSACERTGTEA